MNNINQLQSTVMGEELLGLSLSTFSIGAIILQNDELHRTNYSEWDEYLNNPLNKELQPGPSSIPSLDPLQRIKDVELDRICRLADQGADLGLKTPSRKTSLLLFCSAKQTITEPQRERAINKLISKGATVSFEAIHEICKLDYITENHRVTLLELLLKGKFKLTDNVERDKDTYYCIQQKMTGEIRIKPYLARITQLFLQQGLWRSNRTSRILELSSREARLNTFADWPPGFEQRPAQLAEAGFYYLSIIIY